MSKRKGTVSHHEAELAELRADRELAVEYLKAAMESLDDPQNRAAGLLALRTVAEAYGGLGAVAAQAGLSREALYRALSPQGQPDPQDLAGRAQDHGAAPVGGARAPRARLIAPRGMVCALGRQGRSRAASAAASAGGVGGHAAVR